eukprot:sb/3468274/
MGHPNTILEFLIRLSVSLTKDYYTTTVLVCELVCVTKSLSICERLMTGKCVFNIRKASYKVHVLPRLILVSSSIVDGSIWTTETMILLQEINHTTVSSNIDIIRLKISESFSEFVISFIRSHTLPIRVVFTPGTKLRNLFCKSRPYDRTHCHITNCLVCPLMTHPTLDCTVKGVVYKIVCKLCNEIYVGETARPCRERFKEHRLAAKSPNIYPNEALAAHYLSQHNGEPPDLEFDILATGLDHPVRRKPDDVDVRRNRRVIYFLQ